MRPAITQDEPEEPVDDAFDFEEPMDESEDQETPVIVARAVPPLVAAAVPPPLPHLEDGPAAGDDPAADAALAAAIERLARHGDGAGGPRIHATTLDLFDLFTAGERPAASQPPAPFLPRGRRREVSESSSDYYGVTRVANRVEIFNPT